MPDSSFALSEDALLHDARRVLVAGQRALDLLCDGLDAGLVEAAEAVAGCAGRILVSGMGKSGIAARKLAATLCTMGIPAQFLHAADALHGELGALHGDDLLIAISVSGATRELLPLVQHARHLGTATIAITSNSQSTLAIQCDRTLLLPRCEEGSGEFVAPMASTIATMALGDALALVAAKCGGHHRRGQIARLHPGGEIGRQLRPVVQVMHGGERVPLVAASATVDDIIAEITLKGFGIAGVTNANGILLGTISDGDIRRHFDELTGRSAAELMMHDPVTLRPDSDVGEALDLMRTHRISAIYIVNAQAGRVEGLVHLQDLLRIGIL